jgi:hypothetical protein
MGGGLVATRDYLVEGFASRLNLETNVMETKGVHNPMDDVVGPDK